MLILSQDGAKRIYYIRCLWILAGVLGSVFFSVDHHPIIFGVAVVFCRLSLFFPAWKIRGCCVVYSILLLSY